MEVRVRSRGGKSLKLTIINSLRVVAHSTHTVTLSYSTGVCRQKDINMHLSKNEARDLMDDLRLILKEPYQGSF